MVAKLVGRPPKPEADRKTANVKFRVRNGIHERIAAAAAVSGRSRSEEVEARLEASFRNDDIRTIVREEIRAALGDRANEQLGMPVVHAGMTPDQYYRVASIGAHSHTIRGDDGSLSCGGLTVSPVQSQIHDRSALNGKQ